ncbi:MAG: trigger factor [Lachnospiraceae bacterium]|nr:trigger factor [Lachnospiraceae bacterium]
MKKYRRKTAACILGGILMAVMITGCGSSSSGGAQSLDKTDPAAYVTLGDYKGLSINSTDSTVSDADVDSYIQNTLAGRGELKEVTGRAAKLGDTVNIDYEGRKDGVAFEGGTGNYDLELGSGSFIPGFEEGVVGMEIGETKDLELTFPEDYGNTDLAGAKTVFTVTVNSISENELPELNDEFVKGLNNGASTVDEYRELVRTQLTEQNESSAKASEETDLLELAVDNAECDMSKLPQWLVSQNAAEYKSSTESFIQQYGMSLDDYLSGMGSDKESFENEAKEYGEKKAKSDLVILAISKAEGIEVTEKELEDYYAGYAADYKATVEQVKAAIPEDELKAYLLEQKVADFLYDNAVITGK